MFVILITTFLTAPYALAVAPGTYQALRTCSDGSPPHDTLRMLTVVVADDGTYRTLSETAQEDGPCAEVWKGRYELKDNVFTTYAEGRESCGRCDQATDEHPVVSLEFQPIPTGFRVRMNTEYGPGGSCKPGQYMTIDFVRISGEVKKLKPFCESPTS